MKIEKKMNSFLIPLNLRSRDPITIEGNLIKEMRRIVGPIDIQDKIQLKIQQDKIQLKLSKRRQKLKEQKKRKYKLGKFLNVPHYT